MFYFEITLAITDFSLWQSMINVKLLSDANVRFRFRKKNQEYN